MILNYRPAHEHKPTPEHAFSVRSQSVRNVSYFCRNMNEGKLVDFSGLVRANRSYRKFDRSRVVTEEELISLIELARMAPSSKNRQALKFVTVTEEQDISFVFRQLKWAWFLKDWEGPAEHERPPAYIMVLLDKQLNDKADFDAGIAAQTILLGAVERGLGGCIVRTINRYELGKYFQLPEFMEIVLILAIGKPNQIVVLDDEDYQGNMEYWTDEEGRHHVPKRSLDELMYKPPARNDQD
jgi:nitroreductase